ncbi:NADH-quinone oxidoreductase subunit M [Altericista sp. CCNU0014]|uniref:NADH-quinone oxidoreductase subunit M n=1 Tax=Altericista sp. CCNU0014 TaxID=3082949 RepID=UPI00384C53B9
MLSLLLWIPLAGAIALALWPQFQTVRQVKGFALAVSVLALVWTAAIGVQFDVTAAGSQFQETIPWLDDLGLRYQVGVDGLSYPLVALNSLLTCIAIYSSDDEIERPRFYYSLMLLLNFGVVGAFLAENLLLFFLFYEIELIPLYLLIGIWGGARRGYAATKFLIYTAVSGIAILGSFLGLVWLSGADSFAYQPDLANALSLTQQVVLLGGLLLGFGIKIPLVPLHTWLPDAHVEASTPVSVLLAGVLLKLGTYGLLRFGVGLFPEAWAVLAPWLASWAVVSVLYGAFTAIAQTDMKKMVAFSSVGHMGFILLAAAAATPLSLVAVELQMVSHGLISALLFLLVGVVYKKTGTRDLTVLRGLLNPERGLPVIGSLMVVGVMASAGIPGMVGFISEFLVFRGSFAAFPVQTLLCMVGTGLTAVYFLLLVNQAFFGRLTTRADGKVVTLPPVAWSDRYPGIILAILIVLFGLQPSWITGWTESSLTQLTTTPTSIAALPDAADGSAVPVPPALAH